MSFRLLALDLDGTLLDSDLRIRPETLAAVGRVRALGVEVMIATGRHHVAAYPYWHQLGLDTPAICCNGAYLYDFRGGQALAGDPLSRPVARELLALVRKHGVFAMVYDRDSMIYEEVDEFLGGLFAWSATLPEGLRPRVRRTDSYEALIDAADDIWKFVAGGDDPAIVDAFAAEVEERLGLACAWSGRTRLDITTAGNSKGARLADWIAGRGIAPGEVIAIGDHFNDVEMLALAGVGVAMANGPDAVRAGADWVTGSNDGDGVARALARFIPG